MSDTTILHGDAAISAATETDFAGMLSPRRFAIAEGLAARADQALADAFAGHWGAAGRLAEAISTSDFRMAAFAELDKEMLAQYEELPTTWRQYTDVTYVSDFRPKRLRSRWSETVGFARVPELTEYPAAEAGKRSEYAIAVAKYGRRYAISWEAWRNNQAIDELADLPAELARNAAETETVNALANLLAIDDVELTASDVNKTLFPSPARVPLTRANLKAALDGMQVKKDPDTKRVIAAPAMVLVVPKALESAVRAIVAPTLVRVTDPDTGTVAEQPNEFSSLDYVVEPMLDYLNQHRNAATTWFLVPKPGGRRPALWAAFLRGYEQPDLRVRAATGQALSGGQISPLEGSFELDDIQYRGRHIIGHQTGENLFCYASYGA